MPLGLGNPPSIHTPGLGPNGPGVIDNRAPITSVGVGTSSCPYGPTNGYATDGGVTGFKGPAAGSLQQPSTWYVRIGGSANNGGSSSSLTADRSGSDATTNNTTTVTSASANFTQADVGKGIAISSGGFTYFRIVAVTNSTTAILDRPCSNGGSQQWNIGGAWDSLQTPLQGIGAGHPGTPMQSGDTIYVGAGTYRKTQTLGLNGWTNLLYNGVLTIQGDTTGQYTGDAGPVILTAYTTNDTTAPSGSSLLNLNGKSNLTFQNIMFVGGGATTIAGGSAGPQNITFRDCAFTYGKGGATTLTLTSIYGLPMNVLIDRCTSYSLSAGGGTNGTWITLTLAQGGGGDYGANVVIQNSTHVGAPGTTAIVLTASGSGTSVGGGVAIRSSSFIGQILSTSSASLSTKLPCTVYGCAGLGGISVLLNANTSGQIVEDYNLLVSTAARTNVTAGTHSISDGSYAGLFHFGQERIWGGLPRPFGEPMKGSPLLGFSPTGGGGPDTTPVVDLYQRWRPAGSSTPIPAVGALERGNTAAQATSPAPTSGTHVWQGTGPWQQDLLLPVAAAADGFSIQVQRDSSYAASPAQGNPTLEILANPTIGVTYQKITDTGGTGTWNTLTAQSFTPTAVGWVTVRVTSYDASGASVVSFAVAAPS